MIMWAGPVTADVRTDGSARDVRKVSGVILSMFIGQTLTQ